MRYLLTYLPLYVSTALHYVIINYIAALICYSMMLTLRLCLGASVSVLVLWVDVLFTTLANTSNHVCEKFHQVDTKTILITL